MVLCAELWTIDTYEGFPIPISDHGLSRSVEEVWDPVVFDQAVRACIIKIFSIRRRIFTTVAHHKSKFFGKRHRFGSGYVYNDQVVAQLTWSC